MKDSYVEQIVNWPVPTSQKELRSWLGFTGYYREFSYLTNEANSQRSKKTFIWTDQMQEKFVKLKEAFLTKPI